jgi:hypothetical protein
MGRLKEENHRIRSGSNRLTRQSTNGRSSPDQDQGGKTHHQDINVDSYLLRDRLRTENQYESLRRDLSNTIQHQGWMVKQVSFIAGARSLNEQDLRKNLKFFQVPEASIESIRSKLVMYSTRFNECTTRSGTSTEAHSNPDATTPSLISSLETGRPNKFRR